MCTTSRRLGSITARLFAVSLLTLLGMGREACATDPVRALDLTPLIDQHFARLWHSTNLQSTPADDATYLRRVYLDLQGRIPTVAEARSFLADTNPQKRARLVDHLLDTPAAARHLAQFWRRSWLPQADTQQFSQLADEIERWLAASLQAESSYQQMVRQLLLSDVQQYRSGDDGKLLPNSAFLIAAEFRPENLAANACRSFLGINLDCAQCHDHPFSRWKREQFWQTAAFFVRPAQGPVKADSQLFRLAIPDTEQVVQARLLNGQDPNWPQKMEVDTGRRVLIDWITAPDNAFFARNGVNRLWSHFFGQGLIEPLDDLAAEGPHLHGPLLDDLAVKFVAADWQWKPLARAILLSRVYQSDSKIDNERSRQAPSEFYPAMPIRSLSGEQLYHSLLIATGMPLASEEPSGEHEELRKAFRHRFGSDRSIRSERSVLQSLHLMNGPLTKQLTAAKSPWLSSMADAPFWNDRERIEVLFLAAYSRLPGEDEQSLAIKLIADSRDRRQAMSDLLWAMLNSSEFNCNH